MTADEFERIQTSIRHMAAKGVEGRIFVDFIGVMEIIHSNMHPEDRDAYKMNESLQFVKNNEHHEP